MNCPKCGQQIDDPQTKFCPKCGNNLQQTIVENKPASTFCRNCGKQLIGKPDICMNCGAKPMSGNSYCPACGSATNAQAVMCVKCGTLLATATPLSPSAPMRSGKVTALGILNIIGGGFSLIGSFVLGILILIRAAGIVGLAPWLIALFLLIGGVIPIIGGIFALKQKSWGFVLASSIILFLFSWATFIGFVLGLISIILAAMSKKDFAN